MAKFGHHITYFFAILIPLQLMLFGETAHIRGTFDPDHDFMKVLAKFGFQKTERHSQRDSFGYIYGNVTARESGAYPVPITYAVLDKYSFLEYYGNRSVGDKEMACQRMFKRLNRYAYDPQCNPKARGDYMRRIPCPKGGLCPDEDAPSNVVPENQFTYVISDLMQPRFWYISIVACYRNQTTCKWHHFDPKQWKDGKSGTTNYLIDYDFRLVNGNPNQSASNPLTFHFSFDEQNILEMNLIFFLVYMFLVPMQIYAVRIQKHPVTKLFTLSLILEFISLGFILSFLIRYAIGGVGNETFRTAGDIFDILSRTSFMLILLLLAKGWAVTRQQISRSGWIILMSIWIPYCMFHVVLYVWDRTEVDIISDIDQYQTWPGWTVLACRTSIMLWFLWELRITMKYEHSTKKLDFLLHFGASSLVWFIYLPVVAIVALQVSPMWRYKLLLGITNSADCLAYCVMTGLLWPNRSGQYLLLAGTNFGGMDELDEFNEAPHIVHGDIILPQPNLTEITPSGGAHLEQLTSNRHSINRSDGKFGTVVMNGSGVGGDHDLITADLLTGDDDDDDEDVVLSTNDLFIDNLNQSTYQLYSNQQRNGGRFMSVDLSKGKDARA